MNIAFPRAAMALRLTVCTLAAAMVAAAFQASTLASTQVTHTPVASTTKTVTGALASNTPRRTRAYNYALAQKGDWYCYRKTGTPGCGHRAPARTWDCSGLLYVAYKRVGLPIPRRTQDMLRDSRDVFYRTNHPRKGDLAFFGKGHVEYFVSGTKYNGTTYGAHKSGTRVGYRTYNKYYPPTVFLHRRGAN